MGVFPGEPSHGGANSQESSVSSSSLQTAQDIHHHQSPKIFVHGLKTPEAPYWVGALNTEIKQLIDTGALRTVKLSVINSTMVLRKKPDK